MRSADVALAAGVNVQTLRYYERIGLLPDPGRQGSGYRDYGPEAVRTVRFIKRAQQLGFSLEKVAQLLDLAAGGPEACDAARQMAAQKIHELEEKIASLQAMRGALGQLVATCDRPRASRRCPLVAAIYADPETGLETMSDGCCAQTPGSEGTQRCSAASTLTGMEFAADLLRLIARGQPVAIAEVAAVSGQPPEVVEARLRAQPGTDWDADARLVGFGLTLRRTPHRFVVDGRTLYTWCAPDTLIFPALLGRRATVESTCPASGQTIRLEVAPDGVLSFEPTSTVVSWNLAEGPVGNLRGEVCDHQHFFASRADAERWAGAHPAGEVIEVAEAFRRCQALLAQFEAGRVGGGDR